ncbi:NUDIX domain-containing protein [Candidatus Nanohalobium constans]|nr:NUDIX domain-containing protein [Candidatus Nanohalobium constans]
MKTEKGVIIVAYKESRRNNRYAILKRKKNWEGWELPKGHLEEDDYEDTVKLELGEEAGIKEDEIEEITDLEETAEWTFEEDGEEIKREYKAFIVRVSEEAQIDITENPHDEHEQGFFLKKKDVEGLLTYQNNVEVLERAAEIVSQE